MEFPELSKRCAYKDCQQLDFLPVSCDWCLNVFCKDHSSSFKHGCKTNDNKITFVAKESTDVLCFSSGCNEQSFSLISCTICNHHYCIRHRHHAPCFDNTNKNKVARIKEHKADFLKKKAVLDKQVDDKLSIAVKDSKLSATAIKIRLMKIKLKAIGDGNIALEDRLFFMLYPPFTSSSSGQSVFVSKNWSVGKCIDVLAKKLKIENNNDLSSSPKLGLFNKEDGQILDSSKTLNNLIEENIIINGGSLVLEYQREKTVCLVNGVHILIDLDKYI